MEKKRKLPARAAARVEHVAKRRNVTPHERSVTPATPQPVEEPPPPPPPPLPRSIQPGKPLPTVEEAQPEGLSTKEYQSVSESGVLAESLSRSRQKWISEGLFEKYWTKPHKRKGVVTEDPKNPPKDAMSKVGTVTITIEPHIIEATMYAVKEPKVRPAPGQQPTPSPQPQQQTQPTPPIRPIIQYGPPNGAMPPPPTPTSVAASPTMSVSGASKPEAPSPAQASPRPSPVSHNPQQGQAVGPLESPKPSNLAGTVPTISPSPSAQTVSPQPHPPPPVLPQASAAPPVVPPPSQAPVLASPPVQGPPPAQLPPVSRPAPVAPAQPGPPPPLARPPSNTPIKPAVAAAPVAPAAPGAPLNGPRPYPAPQAAPIRPAGPLAKPGPAAGAPVPAAPAAKPAANDPVIALLAQKASGDPELRDLMKRVAVGQAKDGELAHFQKIIDQLNAEYKRKGGQQGPSADRLVVDGRTVKYFADEVRTILDIVLTSNPQQKPNELRPPPRSDPLVVLLVKKALEDPKTRDMIRRIADSRPTSNDASDLKEILDRLHREMKAIPPKPPIATPAASPARQPVANGVPNGHAKTPTTQNSPNPQALRSKGPPPAPKPDVSAVVFDFGSGDRYLFPKYSILEYLPTNAGQQVVASFLIVRKGSTSEYGGDPKLDYYQPVTIRLSTPTGRHLENLARVVAPQDEVRRYMDDVMDNMTRAEYVLLAMQLPRVSKDGDTEGGDEQAKTNTSTPKPDAEVEQNTTSKKPSVLWNSTSSAAASRRAHPANAPDPEEEAQSRYQKLINSVAARDTESI